MRRSPGRPVFIASLMMALFMMVPCLHGCGRECANVGCRPNVTIYPSPPITAPGSYRVDMATPEVTPSVTSCVLDIPGTGPASCDVVGGYVHRDSRGIEWASFDGKIKNLEVTISRDNVVILKQSFEPTYEDIEFNGPGCGTCPAARETLVVPSNDGG